MLCRFCKNVDGPGFICTKCRDNVQEFVFDLEGFSFLAVMLACADLTKLAEIVEIATNKANAGTLPRIRPPSEIDAEADAIVKGLLESTKAHLEALKEAARQAGACMDCKVPGSIPVGGRPIQAPDGSTIYSAKCAPCTKRGAEAWLALQAERKGRA
jgi:hypothetical protein